MTFDAIEALLQAAISGGAAWAAIKVELRYLSKTAEQAHAHAQSAHERINELLIDRRHHP